LHSRFLYRIVITSAFEFVINTSATPVSAAKRTVLDAPPVIHAKKSVPRNLAAAILFLSKIFALAGFSVELQDSMSTFTPGAFLPFLLADSH